MLSRGKNLRKWRGKLKMSNVSFSDKALEDYIYWQTQDKKTLKRVNALIIDIKRNPFNGIGKPEALKHGESGLWSRRIDDTNRIVYYEEAGVIFIVTCRGHYSDK